VLSQTVTFGPGDLGLLSGRWRREAEVNATARPSSIDRATAEDVVSLATDVGPSPMQVGAVLRLTGPPDLGPAGSDELLRRVCSVPRLRQRLVATRWGCGRPIWVDAPDFDLARHVSHVVCPSPGDDAALLAVAAEVIGGRLPTDRPLWRMTLVTGLGGGEAALVVAFHHVLADGIGGLAVLASLVDGMEAETVTAFPKPPPTAGSLALDALRCRLAAVRSTPEALRLVRAAASEWRGAPRTRAAPTSWNRPTGPRRQLAVVRCELDEIHRTAREHGATVNDVVLAAVAATVGGVLSARGESLEQVVVSVPVSARRETTAGRLGNQVGVVPVALSTSGDPTVRLAEAAAATRAAKEEAGGALPALLGPVFRLLARIGVFGWFIDRQRLVHTFVTNLRGPRDQLGFLGVPITEIDPVALVSGNVTVAFAVLSYAGTLAITIVADPQACPDLEVAGDLLAAELAQFATSRNPTDLT